MTIRFMLWVGSDGNVLAEMHDMREAPAKDDIVQISGQAYEVMSREWTVTPRGSDAGAYRSGYPETCAVIVYVRRRC